MRLCSAAYDAAGQLTSETRGSYAASYGYDGNGNRTFRTVDGVTETYAYDDGDKLQSITSGTDVRAFAYDDRGRRTEEYVNGVIRRTYAWNEDDRLAGIAYSNPSGTPFAGTYGPDGARVGKTDSGGTRAFLRSGPGVTAPVLADGAATYTPGVSEVRGGVSTFSTGGLKNQDAQWSSSGALMATRTYDAFGNLVGSSGSWQGPFGYGGAYGYQEDASTLKLLGHRYYDSTTGSFLTRDPIKDGRNWYAYCAGDPVSAADPEGLTGNKWVTIGKLLIRVDLRQRPFPNAHILRGKGKPSTMMTHTGDIPPTHGGKPNPPLSADERKLLRAEKPRSKRRVDDVTFDMFEDVIKPMLEMVGGRAVAVIALTILIAEEAAAYFEEHADEWREGIEQGMSRRAFENQNVFDDSYWGSGGSDMP